MTKTKKIFFAFLIVFILMNVVAFLHAYKFTHFSPSDSERTKDPKELSVLSKMKLLVTGIDNPKPQHKGSPKNPHEVFQIESTTLLECWRIQSALPKGTVILFHGFSGEKSSLLGRADYFHSLGYNTVLVDFMGSGGSAGNRTSIGFDEAEQVKDCYRYVKDAGEKNIILFGTSMGAAAILKSIDDYAIKPEGIILECPFGSLYKTVCARFTMMGVPSFPMAAMLTFWGGVQNGYWAFSHNPIQYAKSVESSTLILFGEQDDRVSQEEIDLIYANMKGAKILKTYSEYGHNVYEPANQMQWNADVSTFLERISR